MALNRNPPPGGKPGYQFVEKLGFATLYLDDLDAIVRYLSSKAESVRIGAANAIADDAEDLRAATPHELSNVIVQTLRPSILVSLRRTHGVVITYEDNDEARDLSKGVAYLVRGHQSPRIAWWVFLRAYWFAPAMLIAAGALAAIGLLTYPPTAERTTILIGGVIAALALNAVVLLGPFRRTWRRGGVSVIPRARGHAEKSPVVLPILTTVLGAAAGAVVTVVIQNLT